MSRFSGAGIGWPQKSGVRIERDADREQGPDLHRNRRRSQHRQRHQQAADAREDQDEDQELVEVEGEEGDTKSG